MDVAALCSARGWSRSRLLRELRSVAKARGEALPSDESLGRMVRQWANGSRQPGEHYRLLLHQAFAIPDGEAIEPEGVAETRARALAVDVDLVDALEAQTDSLRSLDLRLGGARTHPQAGAHARTIADLVRWTPSGTAKRLAAAAGAEAAALTGWQALDLGSAEKAWRWHDLGRSLAIESGDSSVIAHVTAQQGYVLLDRGDVVGATQQIAAARHAAAGKVPGTLAAWLAAAEGEARAAGGDRDEALRLLDVAHAELDSTQVPYLALDEIALLRWRGHCLARVGDEQALDDLGAALDAVDPGWVRARSGLHADLALALTARGDHHGAEAHAEQVRALAASTGSVRQHNRLRQVLRLSERE